MGRDGRSQKASGATNLRAETCLCLQIHEGQWPLKRPHCGQTDPLVWNSLSVAGDHAGAGGPAWPGA